MNRNQKTSNAQLKRISTASYLEEAEQPRLILTTMIALFVILISLIVWASFTDVAEKAVTYGEVVPKSGVHVIQHLEGGTIERVFVENGEMVKAGALLVQMDKKAIQTELNQLNSRYASFVLDRERILTLLNGEALDSEKWLDSLLETIPSINDEIHIYADILEDERRLFNQQIKNRDDQLQVIDEQIEQRISELDRLSGEEENLAKNLVLLNEEMLIYETLIEKGHVSRKDYIAAQKQLNKAQGDIEKNRSQQEKEQHALNEFKTRRKRTLSDINEKLNEELDNINEKILEYRHTQERLRDRLRRATIQAPIDGIVTGLNLFSGSVIPAGSYVLELVPYDQDLLVESRVNPKDIGHIHIGDPVTIKVLSYDFARYGSVNGSLKSLSATTFNDEQGLPYYKAVITLERTFVGTAENRLIPGMTVEANIITGEKSILSYLLKPIRQSIQGSFSER